MRQVGLILIIPLLGVGIVYYLLEAQVRGNHRANNNHKMPIIAQQVIKDDWLVNDDTLGGCDQIEVSITSTKSLYIIAWVDYRSGYSPDIYMGRFYFNGLGI